ncbi:recombinase family protein [Carnobacterium viridans]|uniref:recombinase family protein n=1 Tax=Carnobacterium viridans TaxID=174587 RepID=UPI000A78EC14|nr:recombinase family protein [Carnobacterium viridans]
MILNLPILNQELSNPSLQKLIRNMSVQLLSWRVDNEREESKRKQRQGIEIAKKKGYYKGRPL